MGHSCMQVGEVVCGGVLFAENSNARHAHRKHTVQRVQGAEDGAMADSKEVSISIQTGLFKTRRTCLSLKRWMV